MMILGTILALTSICVDNPETLIRARSPRPVMVAVTNGSAVQRVEAFTYLQQTKRLSGDAIRWERASVAIQIAILRQPFKRPGELVDYVAGAAAFVDTPVLRPLRTMPKITLEEAVERYLSAKSPDVRREYGEILHLVVSNRANACSFWR